MSYSPKDPKEQEDKETVLPITLEYQGFKAQTIWLSYGQTHTEGAPQNQHFHQLGCSYTDHL